MSIVVGGAVYAAFLSGGHTTRADVLSSAMSGSFSSSKAAQAPSLAPPGNQERSSPAAPASSAQQTSPSSPSQTQTSSTTSPTNDQAVVSAGLADGNTRITAAGTTPEGGNSSSQASATPGQGSSATPAAATATPASLNCDTSVSSLYCIYTIQPGDTLSGIAAKFGLKGNDDVEAAELLVHSNQPDIVSVKDLLQIGQQLRIPLGSAAVSAASSAGSSSSSSAGGVPGSVIHTVLRDETVSDIASQYDVSSADIIAANHLANPDSLQIGQELLVPNPKRFYVPPPPAPTPAPSTSASSSSGSSSSSSSSRSSGPSSVATGPKSNAGFIWPASGPISSYFGPAHPLGIDIDFYANPNQPVGAAAAGTVTFAGGNTCCSYGLYVVVDHGNGYQTLYAHLSQINVSVGQKVSQGQVLGLGGRTGYATGNHLHFEVHYQGSIINPLSVLP